MSVAFDSNVTLTLEAAFGDDAYDTTPTWTDVSAYLRAFTLKRGRSNERDQISASVLSGVLDNADGRFDPTYTSGAYYPNVVLNVPLRLRAVYNAVTYDLFYGFVDQWPQTYPGYNDAVVGFSATDGFKFLANANTDTLEAAERSGARIGNLLDDASWPAGWRALDTGQVTCPAYSRYASVLSLIRQVEKSELGTFFIAGDGTATFHERYHRSNSTSQATFGDSGAELRYQDIVLAYDDTQLWNSAEVEREGQADLQTYSDATSITKNGERTLRQNGVLVSVDSEALGLANLLVDVYGTQDLRVRRLTVTPRRDPSGLWPEALGLELGDKVTVVRRPPAGNTITETLFVEGIGHSADAASRQWTTTFELSHYTPGDTSFLILDDATFGQLDNNVLGY